MKAKKPLGAALHWNEAELEARSEVGQAEVEAARLFLRRRRALRRAARLLEASVGTIIPIWEGKNRDARL